MTITLKEFYRNKELRRTVDILRRNRFKNEGYDWLTSVRKMKYDIAKQTSSFEEFEKKSKELDSTIDFIGDLLYDFKQSTKPLLRRHIIETENQLILLRKLRQHPLCDLLNEASKGKYNEAELESITKFLEYDVSIRIETYGVIYVEFRNNDKHVICLCVNVGKSDFVEECKQDEENLRDYIKEQEELSLRHREIFEKYIKTNYSFEI